MAGREFEIIERYFAGFAAGAPSQVVLGPGDDCAILEVPADCQLAVSTDTFVIGVHFPSDAPAAAVAHRCLAANLSDLAAMGATPFAFVLALTMPAEHESWLEGFSASLHNLVSEFAIPLVGGNMARGELAITLTVMGTLPRGHALRRTGARPGDGIYVTGTLGDAGGGLALIQSQRTEPAQLINRYYYPTARLDMGAGLLRLASSGIDISDGLIADLSHICDCSRVGAVVSLDALPMSLPLVQAFSLDQARLLAAGAGDDYELCFTAPAAAHDAIQQLATGLDLRLTRIGEIVAGDAVRVVDAQGAPISLGQPGYQHFHDDS
jgi:thiamine-monophosphate kinase